MSRHCSKYPSCGCPTTGGTKCYSDGNELERFKAISRVWVGGSYRELLPQEQKLIESGRKILKTNGKSEYVFVDNPERFSFESERIIKRRRQTNFTTKKKKRK